MAEIDFIIDLAIVMLIAAVVTMVFSRFRLPIILGYLIAGMIIGPYTYPFQLVTDETLIGYLASLGVVLLLFTLGLEFTLSRLREIGLFALAIGTIEIVLMIGLGFWTGILLGFPENLSLLLGAILAISSTAIVVKTMQDRGIVGKQHSQIVVGVMVVEDIAAVAIMTLISGFGGPGATTLADTMRTVLSMALFFAAAIAIGYLFVPRLISYIAKKMPSEVLLMVSLAFCFSLAILSDLVLSGLQGFSLAIGAFIAGMLVGESQDSDLVVLKMIPIKEMFVAVFFVTMGMLFDPSLLLQYWVPVVVLIIVFVLGKIALVGTGSLIFGFPAKTAFLAGTGIVAIGEFSFIICQTAINKGFIAQEYSFILSITVMVATVTAFILPFMARNGERLFDWMARHAPRSVKTTASVLQGSMVSVRAKTKQSPEVKEEFHQRSTYSLIDVALIAIIALMAKLLLGVRTQFADYFGLDESIMGIIISVASIALLLPPAVNFSRNVARMISLASAHSSVDGTQKRRGIARALSSLAAGIVFIVAMLIALPFAIDSGQMISISPAVFVAAIVVISLLAWSMNKTIYRSFSQHIQRDIMKEHVNTAESQVGESQTREQTFLEGKEE